MKMSLHWKKSIRSSSSTNNIFLPNDFFVVCFCNRHEKLFCKVIMNDNDSCTLKKMVAVQY